MHGSRWSRRGRHTAPWRPTAGLRALVVLLCTALVAAVSVVVPAALPVANAATIPFGNVLGRAHDQTGYTDSGFTNATTAAQSCTKYSPTTGTGSSSTSSAWVNPGSTAYVAHGASSYPCNTGSALDTSDQSAVGVTPNTTTSVSDGTPFVVAKMTHYNNPISGNFPAWYKGTISLQFAGMTAPNTVDFSYELQETPNSPANRQCDPSPEGPNPDSYGQGVNANGCADWIYFDSQVSTTTLTAPDGTKYKLVLKGFSSTSCTSYNPSATAQTFWTKERATTDACIWASFQQVRSLTVKKTVVAPAGVTPPAQAFSFNSTSDLRGSAWDAKSWTLTDGGTRSGDLLQDETVGVTETQLGGKWSLTDISCVDGTGASVAVDKNLTSGQMSLKVGAPATTAAAPITCTYTNSYQPQGTLTLRKVVASGSAAPSSFTLSAAGPTPISGPGNSAAVTNQTVNTGSYTLNESGPNGYISDAGWSCTGGTLSGNVVTVTDSANVTCTITNRQAVGSLQIRKVVSGPSGGFPNSSYAFSGTYNCGTGFSGTFSTLTTGTPVTVAGIPAGSSCTVTENAPTGSSGLANTSYTWSGTPTFDPSQSVTIADQTVAVVTITNTFVQNTGSLVLAKKVQPRDGTDQTGYTGGSGRAFPMAYTCTIGGTTTASGTRNVTPGATVTVTGIPATSSCAVTETLTGQSGDFADASYAWDGSTTDGPKTIPVNGSATVTTTNYFTKLTGRLTLVKRVQGDGYTGGTGKHFTVDWDCGSSSGTVTLAKDGSETVTVPANLGCSVTEEAPSGNLATGYEWGQPTIDGLTNGVVTVAPDGTSTVTVTNTTNPVYGTLSVTKHLTGETGGVVGGSHFPVLVSCDAPAQGETADYSHVFQLLPENPQSTPNLQVGTSCTVTEQGQPDLLDDSYAWDPIPDPQTVTIDSKGQVVGVTVTNNVRRVYGALTISKAVTPLDGLDGSGVTFTGTWSCSYGTTTYSGTWSRTGTGAATLSGDDATRIPLTSRCSATEGTPDRDPSTTDPSYNWGGATITGPVTLTADNPTGHIDVTNTIVRSNGRFTVGKVVNGGEAGTAFDDDVFTFTYSCQPRLGAAIIGTLTTKAGGTAQLPAGVTIPLQSVCTVTETGKAAPRDPYRWDGTTFQVDGGAPTTDRATFTVRAANVPVTVIVTNTLEEVFVPVTVTKRVTGETSGYTGTTFTGYGRCTSPDGSTRIYGPATLARDESVTEGVLLGSTNCTIVETPPGAGEGLADESYAWGESSTDPPSLDVTDPDGDYRATVYNPIVRVRGQLALTKVLRDPDSVVDPTRTYSGAWTCSRSGDPDVSGTWTVTGPGPATLSGVPTGGILLGSTCEATENDLSTPPAANGDPSYSWGTPTFESGTVTGDHAGAMTVTNIVNRTVGDVEVSKTVTGETLGYVGTGEAFTVDYRCSPPAGSSASPLTGTATVGDGQTTDLATGIPSGWSCVADEHPPGEDLLRNASYSWGTPTVSGPVTVTAGGTATITVENPIVRNYGELSVVKTIGANADAVTSGASFTGTYSCSYGSGDPDEATFSGTWSVTGPGVATLDPVADRLPVGTECTIAEDDPSGGLVDGSWTWGTPKVTQPETVQGVGSTSTGTVVNTPARVFGSLDVTKVFEGDADTALVPGAKVTGAWRCDYDTGTRPEDHVTGTWTVAAAGGTTTLFAADGSVTGDGGDPILVPATASCVIVENTPGQDLLTDSSYTWASPVYDPAGGVVTVPTTGTGAVTITNSVTRVNGSLEVRKVIQMPEGVTAEAEGLTFSGTVLCTHRGDPDFSAPWSLTYPETTTVDGILLNSRCSVTETLPRGGSPKASDISYVWAGDPDITPGSATVTGPASDAQFTVTNHVTRALTHLTVTKELSEDSATPPDGLLFGMSYRCTDQSGGVHTGSKTIAVGETWTTDATIPVGSSCTVSEDDLPDVSPRFTWVGTSMTVENIPVEVTRSAASIDFDIPPLGADGPVFPAVTVTNELQRATSGWVLNKSSDPASGAQVVPGQTITYSVTVTPTGPGVTDDIVVTDDLSGVLPYATVDDVDAPQGSASISGNTLTWNVGTLEPDGPITLTYKAKVKPGEYDVVLKNVVTGTGETPPGPCDTCETTTEHPTPPAYTVSKTADPKSGSTVKPGQTVTYTVTVHNESIETPLDGVVVTDDLSDVLGAATFDRIVSGGPASVRGTQLTWTVPTVDPDGDAVLTYRVTVNSDAYGATLRNVVTATGPVPPASCDPCTTTHHTPPKTPVTPPTPPPPTPMPPPLAYTGAGGIGSLLLLALGLLAMGGALVLYLRRRDA